VSVEEDISRDRTKEVLIQKCDFCNNDEVISTISCEGKSKCLLCVSVEKEALEAQLAELREAAEWVLETVAAYNWLDSRTTGDQEIDDDAEFELNDTKDVALQKLGQELAKGD